VIAVSGAFVLHGDTNPPRTRPSPMTVLEIREMGDPVLREAAREVTPEELAGEEYSN